MRVFRGFMSNVKFNLKNKPVVESTNKLTIELENTTVATISYVKVDDKTYDLVHTLVPKRLQGQGLGHIFAERIFDHLITQNNQLKLSCKFLQYFYSQNIDKYKGHVLEDFEIE